MFSIQRVFLDVKVAGVVLVLLAGMALSRASGFDQPNQDAFAIGRGQAFTATANNPSAIYYNPAGITQLNGNNIRIGVYGVYADQHYQSPAGETSDSGDRLQGFPEFYYTYGQTNWPVSFGVGVYSPFQFNAEWPADIDFRYVATEGYLDTITINPVVALKLFPNLSIGGGVMVNYAKLDLQRGIPISTAYSTRFRGDDWDVGYNLGVLWQPVKEISIGGTFRSSSAMNFEGETRNISFGNLVYLPSSARSTLPLEAVVGLSYRPTPKWNLEFDADYMDWGMLSALNINTAGTVTTAMPLNWQPSWNYDFGVTRYFDGGWHVSAGYIYSENSVPDNSFSPLIVDSNRHFFSIGVGYTGQRFNFDVAYQFAYSPTRTVSGSPVFSAQTADGQYDYMSHAVAVSVGMRF